MALPHGIFLNDLCLTLDTPLTIVYKYNFISKIMWNRHDKQFPFCLIANNSISLFNQPTGDKIDLRGSVCDKYVRINNETYLNIEYVIIVRIRPANEMPHPIHVIICRANGFEPVWLVSNMIAKLVRWSHTHFTFFVTGSSIVVQPSDDHGCVVSMVRKKKRF